MFKQDAKASVVLPVRSPAPFLPTTLASIRNQTIPVSIYVVLDGRDDQLTSELVEDPIINLIIHETSLGVSAARNSALAQITSKYCATIDADDTWPPDHLESAVKTSESNPSLLLYGTSATLIDVEGKKFGHRMARPGDRRHSLMFRNQFVQSSAVFLSSVAHFAGGWNIEARVAADYDLWMRIAQQGSVWNEPERTVDYRIHGEQMSRSLMDKEELVVLRKSRRGLAKSLRFPDKYADAISWAWEGFHDFKSMKPVTTR
jgi:glycosyltransferase involved in cell wall biosynthesis